jgi:hypothetical protein
MKLLGVTLALVASLLAYAAVGNAPLSAHHTKTAATNPLLASCAQDGDTLRRIRDEVITYARHRSLSEDQFSCHLGASPSEIEELACAAEMSATPCLVPC